MNWTFLKDNWVLCPAQPQGIIHFLGGAFIGSAPQIAYQVLMNRLAIAGYCIITPAFLVQPNHDVIATEVTASFQNCKQHLIQGKPPLSELPTFGFGHSLGAKLQLLIGCKPELHHDGILLMAFNNFESDRAIPFGDLITPVLPLQFNPTPAETLKRVQQDYRHPQTCLIQFQTDTLDSSQNLKPILRAKFPREFIDQILDGDHLTPTNLNLLNIDPLDMVLNPNGVSSQGRVDFNMQKLEQVILKWLTYQGQIFAKRRI